MSPTGDASLSPYDSDSFSDFFRKTFEGDRTVANVLMGYLNSLEVSNPSVMTIRVDSGAAMVDGKLYMNDEAIDYALSAPGSGTDYYRVVLQKVWLTQTVRVQLLVKSGAYESLTQSGATWEVLLAEFTLTSGGVLSAITDYRHSMASNRFKSVRLANSQDTNRFKVQLGVVRWTGGASATGNVTVTFPYAYDTAPTVICTHHGAFYVNCVVQPTTTNVVIYWKDVDGNTHTDVDIAWIASGAMVRN